MEVDVAERHVTIVECRSPWRRGMHKEWTRFPIARLRCTKFSRLWSLYRRDRNLRFHDYDRVPAAMSVEDLLAEIDRDSTAIFGVDVATHPGGAHRYAVADVIALAIRSSGRVQPRLLRGRALTASATRHSSAGVR